MSKAKKFGNISIEELQDLFSAERQLFKMKNATFSISLHEILADVQPKSTKNSACCELEVTEESRKTRGKQAVSIFEIS